MTMKSYLGANDALTITIANDALTITRSRLRERRRYTIMTTKSHLGANDALLHDLTESEWAAGGTPSSQRTRNSARPEAS